MSTIVWEQQDAPGGAIAWETDEEKQKREAQNTIAWEPEANAGTGRVAEIPRDSVGMTASPDRTQEAWDGGLSRTVDYAGKLWTSAKSADEALLAGITGGNLLLRDAAGKVLPDALLPDREGLAARAKYAKEQYEAAMPDTRGMDAFSRGVVNSPGSLVMSAATIPVAVALRNPFVPAIAFGGQETGQAYADTEGSGQPFARRAAHALERGLFEGGLEAVSAGALVKDLLKGTGFGQVLKRYLGVELGAEEATMLGQNFTDWAHLHPEKSLGDWVKEQPEAMLETLGGVVGQGAATAGIGKVAKVSLDALGRKLDAKFAAREEELRKAYEVVLSGGRMDGIPGQKPANMPPANPDGTTPPQTAADALGAFLDPVTGIVDPDTNPHTDIPRITPSPAQLASALLQEERLATGKMDLPDNEEGVASLGNMDEALSNEAFNPVSEQTVQERITELLEEDEGNADIDPNTGRSKAERIARDEFPNALPMSQRDIVWSANPSEVLMTSRQAGPQAGGTVRLVGGNPEQFSPEYVKALGETFQAWTEKYLPPDAKVVVNLSGMAVGHAGAYQLLNNGTHVITPQELVRAQDAADGGVLVRFNTFSQSQTYGAITHEFGHALVMSQFAQGMPLEYANIVADLDNAERGMFGPEQLAQMPQEQAAVVQEFQQRKIAIMTGGMTAQEMMRNWVGVWKAGKDLMRVKDELKSLETFARAALANDGKTLTHKTTALELVHAMGRNAKLPVAESNARAEKYYLSFNEYMAEQFSRYAYSERIDEGTGLGRYFAKALARLRQFFTEMQAEGFIKPTEAFETWVNGVVKARAVQAAEAPKKVRKSRAKALKVQGAVEVVAEVVATNPKANPLDEIAVDEDWTWQVRKLVKDLAIPITPYTQQLRGALDQAIAKGDVVKLGELIRGWEDSLPKFDVKGKGGNWFHVTVGVLGNPLYTNLMPPQPASGDFSTPEWKAHEEIVAPTWQWTRKIVTNYLNKYAGTADDPLKGVMLPTGKTWGQTMDLAISVRPPESERGETLWDLPASVYTVQLRDYIEHAADYLRANVPQAKWFQYDFTRLIAETGKDDVKARLAAEKAALVALEGVPVHKAYADGSKWMAMPDTADERVMTLVKGLGEIGGWCTKEEDAALRYGSGKSRLFTLVDATGKPMAQIQMVTSEDGTTQALAQIKGRFNGEVRVEGLSQARDFVQGGKWTGTKDLQNVGLVDMRADERIPLDLQDRLMEQLGDSYYVPAEELYAALDPMLKELQPQVEAWARAEIAAGRDKVFLKLVLRDFADRTTEPVKHRDLMLQLLGDMQTDDAGLHFDNTGPEGQADRNNSNEAQGVLKRIGMTVKDRRLLAESINFAANLKFNVLQVQQIAATNPNSGLKMFVQFMTMLGALKNKLLRPGAELAKVWEHLPKRQADALEGILRDEELSGQHMTELQLLSGVWTHVAGPKLHSFIRSHGINPDTEEGAKIGKLVLDYKNSILQHIAVRESAAIQMIRERYERAPEVLLVKANQVREAAGKWRQTPFTPRGRFGNYIVKVFAKDPDSGKRELVHVEHFETAALQKAAHEKLLGHYPASDVKATQISNEEGIAMTLPREFLTVLRDTGEFSDKQLKVIGEAMLPITTDKLFKTFARDALKVSGASPDMLRNYANWIEDSANATAKFVYGRKLTQAVAVVRQQKRDTEREGNLRESYKLQRLADMMNRAKGYVVHPLDEYHKTKNVISLTYLLWAPKTVLMNLTGLLQTWAAVTAEFGDVKGHAELGRTMKDLMTGNLSEDDKKMLGKAEAEGFVDQGFGYFMSGLANSGNLARRVRKNVAGRAQRGFVEGGMKAFTAVEVVNRKVTLLSIYRLELERGLARQARMLAEGNEFALDDVKVRQDAYDAAAKKTKLLQNDYAAGNRPAMFQGKQSLFMIFYSFMQYMLWIMTGGYERSTRLEARARGETPRSVMGGMTMRMWILYAVLGGWEGVPFGKTLEMFIQWLSNKYWGGKNVQVEAQLMLRDALGIESHYVRSALQKGLLHDLGGIDLSGSFSMGTPIPGTRWFGASYMNKESAVGGAVLELAGPFGGVAGGATKLGLGDATESKTLGSSMPGMAGTVARAYDAWKTGLTDKHGALVLRDKDGKARKLTTSELAWLAAGFPLTEVSDKREFENQLRQQFTYWSERRRGLIEDYAEATKSKDRALVEDMRKAIVEFAKEAPPEMVIRSADLNSYMRGEIVDVVKSEMDIVSAAKSGMARDIRAATR